MIRAVAFDAAHTLMDPDPPSARVYSEIGARHGRRVTEAALKAALAPLWWSWREERARVTAVSGTSEDFELAWWRTLVDRAFRAAGEERGVDEACFAEIYRHFATGAAWRLHPDVHPALLELRGRGVRTCVISNFDWRLRAVLEELGLLGEFESVTISSEIGWEKPHPNIYLASLAAMQLAPEEVLMVGDDWEHDVAGPASVGMKSVWIRREARPDPRPHITSLAALVDHL